MSILTLEQNGILIGFNRSDGLPEVLLNTRTGTEYLRSVRQPLFQIVLWDDRGEEHKVRASDAYTVFTKEQDGFLTLYFNLLAGKNIWVRCEIFGGEKAGFEFELSVRNQSGWQIRSIEYPFFVLPSAIENESVDWTLWDSGNGNGTLIRGFSNADCNREGGLGGFGEPLQMCGVGSKNDSMCLMALDTSHYVKSLKPIWNGENLEVALLHWYDSHEQKKVSLPYRTRLVLFDDGEWFSAAEHYREWAEEQSWCEQRLWERPDAPSWWLESPIVLSIKERGKRNNDPGQIPSPWCHPLENGIPRISEVAANLDSTLLVQVFHWEKGGGFINGDHFPPASGYDGTRRFFELLHEAGHFGGVYILPLRWTIQATTTGFDATEFFYENDVMDEVCLDAEGDPIRSGYDWHWRRRLLVCGATEGVSRQVIDSFKIFRELGADYIQFDTFNGQLNGCWADDHGHYPGPGRWMSDEAIQLTRGIMAEAPGFVLTLEGEPVERFLPISLGYVERGLQPTSGLGVEKVPLYQFIYHQYTQGFSGENAGSWNTPDNFYMVTAITIVSGDMLMINLGEQGKIAMQAHEIDDFSQAVETVFPLEEIEAFIRDMNALRRDQAREYLVLGKMLRTPRITCRIGRILEGRIAHPWMQDRKWQPDTNTDYHVVVPAAVGSTWTSPEGVLGTVLVNHTREVQDVSADLRYDFGDHVDLCWHDGTRERTVVSGQSISLTMRPLSGVVVRPEHGDE